MNRELLLITLVFLVSLVLVLWLVDNFGFKLSLGALVIVVYLGYLYKMKNKNTLKYDLRNTDLGDFTYNEKRDLNKSMYYDVDTTEPGEYGVGLDNINIQEDDFRYNNLNT